MTIDVIVNFKSAAYLNKISFTGIYFQISESNKPPLKN